MAHDRSPAGGTGRLERGHVPRIEAYESGVETVIFDGENPLAWIASPAAIPLEHNA